ncbi:hypothetical protein, partial [Yersinia wautersii]|uniref:hypothetical protein n=1 Tax=Yersinia wautersii TaxID=1341643 RepID=UPI001EE35B9C
ILTVQDRVIGVCQQSEGRLWGGLVFLRHPTDRRPTSSLPMSDIHQRLFLLANSTINHHNCCFNRQTVHKPNK